MGLKRWARESVTRVNRDGVAGARSSAARLCMGAGERFFRLRYARQEPTNVFERSWDVLVVLDGCRYDLLQYCNDIDFIRSRDRIVSVGSTTTKWMTGTFCDESVAVPDGTAYITGNPFSNQCLTGSECGFLIEAWQTAWDKKHGTILPRQITDRAIAAWREHNVDRMIIHYMQPHYPFIEYPEMHGGLDPDQFGNMPDKPVWNKLRDGDIERKRVWEAYLSNFGIVMDELQFLIQCIDAESVVTTADHGNAFGEFGQYGHPAESWNPYVRFVPWWQTTAERSNEYTPDLQREGTDRQVENKLRDLGYL